MTKQNESGMGAGLGEVQGGNRSAYARRASSKGVWRPPVGVGETDGEGPMSRQRERNCSPTTCRALTRNSIRAYPRQHASLQHHSTLRGEEFADIARGVGPPFIARCICRKSDAADDRVAGDTQRNTCGD